MERYADSHLHADGMGYEGSECASLLSVCSARESDWESVGKLTGSNIVRSYGTHPWYAEGWDSGSIGRLRSILEKDPEANVGEIGLDADEGPDMVLQATCFEEQFALASELGRTVTIHNLRCESWVLAAVRRNHKGCRAVILHSFAGPESYVSSYSKYGCYFSLSPRLLAKGAEKVKAILSKVPRDRLLIETDAPNFGRDFVSVESFVNDLAQLLSIDPAEFAGIAAENAERAFR